MILKQCLWITNSVINVITICPENTPSSSQRDRLTSPAAKKTSLKWFRCRAQSDDSISGTELLFTFLLLFSSRFEPSLEIATCQAFDQLYQGFHSWPSYYHREPEIAPENSKRKNVFMQKSQLLIWYHLWRLTKRPPVLKSRQLLPFLLLSANLLAPVGLQVLRGGDPRVEITISTSLNMPSSSAVEKGPLVWL